MSKYRNFCFTHNNPADSSLEDSLECRYIIYGREVAPTTGTPHYQGFVSFSSQKTLSAAIKLLPGCHVEIARDWEAAVEYCKKEGDFVERGVPLTGQKEKGNKEKRRWDQIHEAAAEGRFEDIDPEIRVKYPRNLDYIRQQALLARDLPDTEERHEWYWGTTGTGKSRKARTENPDAYLKMCNKWWDGYTDQAVVLLEDFDKAHGVLGHHLKIWGDRYPFPAEKKGGSMVIRPTKIIVTSNYHPKDIWEDNETLLPILRRFKTVEFKTIHQQKKKAGTGDSVQDEEG